MSKKSKIVRARCGSCGNAMEVPGHYRGRSVRCEGCAADVPVPLNAERVTGRRRPRPSPGEQVVGALKLVIVVVFLLWLIGAVVVPVLGN
jgi:hypothetical protein